MKIEIRPTPTRDAVYRVFLFDEIDTLVPVSYAREEVIGYLKRPDLKEKVRERTGIEDVAVLLETIKKLKKENPEKFKNDSRFRQYIDALDIGRQMAYEKKELPLTLFDDVAETLESIASARGRIGIYSSMDAATLKAGWDQTAFGRLIEQYFSAKDIATKDKLSSQSYRTIARTLRVHPEEMVYTTDTEAEAEAAVNADVGAVYLICRSVNEDLDFQLKGTKRFKMIKSLGRIIMETTARKPTIKKERPKE